MFSRSIFRHTLLCIFASASWAMFAQTTPVKQQCWETVNEGNIHICIPFSESDRDTFLTDSQRKKLEDRHFARRFSPQVISWKLFGTIWCDAHAVVRMSSPADARLLTDDQHLDPKCQPENGNLKDIYKRVKAMRKGIKKLCPHENSCPATDVFLCHRNEQCLTPSTPIRSYSMIGLLSTIESDTVDCAEINQSNFFPDKKELALLGEIKTAVEEIHSQLQSK